MNAGMLRVLCLLLVSGSVFVGCRPVPMQEEGGRRAHDVPNQGQPIQPLMEKHQGDLPSLDLKKIQDPSATLLMAMKNPVGTRHNNLRIRMRRDGNDD